MDLGFSTDGANLTRWFAVQTRPRYEQVASTIIADKGHTCLLPTYQECRQWSDRKKALTKPLFPGYFFCQGQAGSIGKVRSTTGVLRIVGFSGHAIPVEDSEIEAIQRVMSSGLNPTQHEYLAVGDQVRLAAGPLAGVQGILSSRKNEYRFVVTVGLLRRSISVEVDSTWLLPLSRRRLESEFTPLASARTDAKAKTYDGGNSQTISTRGAARTC